MYFWIDAHAVSSAIKLLTHVWHFHLYTLLCHDKIKDLSDWWWIKGLQDAPDLDQQTFSNTVYTMLRNVCSETRPVLMNSWTIFWQRSPKTRQLRNGSCRMTTLVHKRSSSFWNLVKALDQLPFVVASFSYFMLVVKLSSAMLKISAKKTISTALNANKAGYNNNNRFDFDSTSGGKLPQ